MSSLVTSWRLPLPFWIHARQLLRLGFLAALVAVGCKILPTIEFSLPFGHSGWIELKDVHVLDDGAPAFAVAVVSRKNHATWVRFSIDQIEGRNDCESEFKLEPRASHPYVCRQASLEEGARYRAEIVVYEDQGNTRIAERIHRIVELQRNESGALELIGRPTD